VAYCTQSDVERAAGGANKLVELADWDPDGTVDAAVLTDAIDASEEWINSYAQRRYNVPFSVVPDIIKRTCAEETVYRLKIGREADVERDRMRHEEREEWLDRLSRGFVSVGVDPEPAESDAIAPESADNRDGQETAIDDGLVVTRESTEGFW
jgi:phage gp36-like protein